jgi:hypothetical protein
MPTASIGIDASAFERKAMEATRTEAVRRRLVVESAERLVRRQLELASEHVDTGRYMRATAEAGNAARLGLATFPLAPVGPSKMAVRMHRILINQVGLWQRRKVACEKRGEVKSKNYRRIVKMLRRSREELQKFKDNESAGVLMIGAFNNSDKLATVRVNFQAYGGTGSVRSIGSSTVVMLHNKEPHASIVESRFAITRTAIRESAVLKRFAKRKYQEHLRTAGFKAG